MLHKPAEIQSQRMPRYCRFLSSVSWAEWAEQLTQMGRGKHFIGDFLPPDELEKFMETFKALKVKIAETWWGGGDASACSRSSEGEISGTLSPLSQRLAALQPGGAL